jgi:hypothetical protein
MNSDLQDRIYQAQCFGNVEPIEFMVPYPNIYSLVEGQNIKFSESSLYPDLFITNKMFLKLTHQAASWIHSNGGKPESRIFLPILPFPYSEILAFGIWLVGGSVIITDNGKYPENPKIDILNIISPDINFKIELSKLDTEFTPMFKPNLLDEALVVFEKGNGIRLSHYNLLVNANGIQKHLNLKRGSSIKINLTPTMTSWAIFQVILPFYTGTYLTHKKANFTFGLLNQFKHPDILLQPNWVEVKKTRPPTIYLLSENSGALTLNEEPIHLTQFSLKTGQIKLNGHSVMMGYVDEVKNEKCFLSDSLNLEICSN